MKKQKSWQSEKSLKVLFYFFLSFRDLGDPARWRLWRRAPQVVAGGEREGGGSPLARAGRWGGPQKTTTTTARTEQSVGSVKNENDDDEGLWRVTAVRAKKPW